MSGSVRTADFGTGLACLSSGWRPVEELTRSRVLESFPLLLTFCVKERVSPALSRNETVECPICLVYLLASAPIVEPSNPEPTAGEVERSEKSPAFGFVNCGSNPQVEFVSGQLLNIVRQL